METDKTARQTERGVLLVLRRAVPRRHVHHTNAPQTTLLRLQHDYAVYVNNVSGPAGVLYPLGQRGESDDGYYHSAINDCVSNACCGEYAPYVWRASVSR